MACATVDDLEKRWRALSCDEVTVAQNLLDDAETMISLLLAKRGVDLADQMSDDIFARALVFVECNVVKRSMMAGSDTFGLTQHSMTAGSFNESMTFANPSGDIYLTKTEKKMLGLTGSMMWSIPPNLRCLS